MKFTFGRQQSDSSLISAVKKGDKGAYEQLFVRYYPTLLRFIHGMLKDNHMAEDIAQNIFMKLWIHREKLDSTQSLKNYLFVLAKHEIFNIFKAKRTTMLSLLPQLNAGGQCPNAREKHPAQAFTQIEISHDTSFGYLWFQEYPHPSHNAIGVAWFPL